MGNELDSRGFVQTNLEPFPSWGTLNSLARRSFVTQNAGELLRCLQLPLAFASGSFPDELLQLGIFLNKRVVTHSYFHNLIAQSSLLYCLYLMTSRCSLKWTLQAIGNRCAGTLKTREHSVRHYHYHRGKEIYIYIAFKIFLVGQN